MTEEQRPSPEALLEEAKSEHRGKLKIFLGAAPGVGKTFAMLNAARARVAEGVDTVVGIVETHRRSETEALAEGIEVIPRRKLDYRGLKFDEMDIDAILARKPQLVLVDELAHTNIPGARHRKRYQDVEEILEAGIDVYSTLNVQHIESLNDIVARITGVTVRETVPDTIVQTAATIELIDLPPEELLKRLQEGKVYIPEQARLAINRFFTHGNLTALRELALRQAAARVDEEMTSYMRRHAIQGPWPTSNRIMVCISEDGQAVSLIRTARRSAERRQTPWLVLYVETSRYALIPESARADIVQAIELAESMGAETMTVTGEDVSAEILRVARERNVSTIIIGKSVRSLWSRLARPSVASSILTKGDGFDILLVTNRDGKRNNTARAKPDAARRWRARLPEYAQAAGIVAIATILAAIMSQFMAPAFLSFFYFIAIFLVVLDFGFAVSAFAALLGGVALDALMAPHAFLLPRSHEDGLALLFYFVTGIAISAIGGRIQLQTAATRRHAERTQALYDFTRSIAAAATIDDVAQITAQRVASTLGVRTALLLPRGERLETAAAVPSDLRLDTASGAAMNWAWLHGKPAGLGSDTLPGAAFYGQPLQSGSNTVGVLAVRNDDDKGALTPDQNHFLSSLAYQAASAIERAKLVTDVAQARLQTETEKLRASLLSSISYDLRAPLDNIIAITRNLDKRWNEIEPQGRMELIASIGDEAGRLDRFVQNFLDMTELVTGNIRLARKPVALRDVVGMALLRLSRQIGGRDIKIDIPDDLPPVNGDEAVLQRVFANIIENACAYSPSDQPVHIVARARGPGVTITITDRGSGIPESERERVFDMFYRAKSDGTQNSIRGAGLGLSICRGFIEAHHGTIKARPGEDGTGTRIEISLPVGRM
ncbi:MAG: sensor histidine kinase KdpD [Alphaproteobacteria bacterium]|nr:sensor histidine kinase KdpD [Alphaproteobacteria bacterium]